jgi:hypothetical protein
MKSFSGNPNQIIGIAYLTLLKSASAALLLILKGGDSRVTVQLHFGDNSSCFLLNNRITVVELCKELVEQIFIIRWRGILFGRVSIGGLEVFFTFARLKPFAMA